MYLEKFPSHLTTVKSKLSFRVWTLSYRQCAHKRTPIPWTPLSFFYPLENPSTSCILANVSSPKATFLMVQTFLALIPLGLFASSVASPCIIINLALQSRTPLSSAKFYHSFFRTLLDSCDNTTNPDARLDQSLLITVQVLQVRCCIS